MKLFCFFLKRHLTAYVDRELPQELAARVERHVQACPCCGQVVAELRQLSRIVAPPAIEPSTDFDRLFWTRLAREREKPEQGLWQRLAAARSCFTSPAGLSLSAALAMALFIVSLYFMRPPDQVVQQSELAAAADLEMYANLEVIENSEALENFELIEMLDELQQDEQG